MLAGEDLPARVVDTDAPQAGRSPMVLGFPASAKESFMVVAGFPG